MCVGGEARTLPAGEGGCWIPPFHGCSDPRLASGSTYGVFRGLYESVFESSSFALDGFACVVLLDGDLYQLWTALLPLRRPDGGSVWSELEVEGELSEPGCYDMGIFERKLVVTRVLKAKARASVNEEWQVLDLSLIPTPTPPGPLPPEKLRP